MSCRGPGPGPARTKRYTRSREEEEDAQICPCGKAKESRTHVAGECEVYNEERDVSDMTKIDKCEIDKFGTHDSREKLITTQGDRRWPHTAKQEGDKIDKTNLMKYMKKP